MSRPKLPPGVMCYRCSKIAKRRERDTRKIETGKYICISCYNKDYDHDIRKNDPNSRNNIIRSLANCRTGNQNPNHSNTKGDLFQELTCIWRSTVSTVPVEDLNKKLDNHGTPIDHSIDSELGIIQTKGSSQHIYYQGVIRYEIWTTILKTEFHKEFDYLIFYCISEDGKFVERIYIFPWYEIVKRQSIKIFNNTTNHWYDECRIKDEETIKKVNEIWREIISGK